MDRNVKVKCKTIKFLDKNTENLYDLWFSTYTISHIRKKLTG